MKKWMFAASIALLATACVHGRVDPGEAVVVEPRGADCLDMSRNGAIPLVVTNRSPRRVAFHVAGVSGPPYVLHPYAFAIDFVEPKSYDNVVAAIEHFYSPTNDVWLGAGDRAEVEAYASIWPRPGYTGMVRARITDTNGRHYRSRELAVCAADATSTSGR